MLPFNIVSQTATRQMEETSGGANLHDVASPFLSRLQTFELQCVDIFGFFGGETKKK